AVIAMMQGFAVALAPSNIRVNAISPGNVRTPMNDPIFSVDTNREQMEMATPARRLGNVSEIADIALFLASAGASYIYGAAIIADGGLSISRAAIRPQSD